VYASDAHAFKKQKRSKAYRLWMGFGIPRLFARQ
jgi:hypothetical protein